MNGSSPFFPGSPSEVGDADSGKIQIPRYRSTYINADPDMYTANRSSFKRMFSHP